MITAADGVSVRTWRPRWFEAWVIPPPWTPHVPVTPPIDPPVVPDDLARYVVPAVTNTYILPTTTISDGYLSSTISLRGAPDAPVTASFVIKANVAYEGLSLVPSALTSGGNTIAASNVKIRAVKCWYVANPYAGECWVKSGTTHLMRPELLLNDVSFVMRGEELGYGNQENYVKKTNGTYMQVSGGTPSTTRSHPLTSAMPIRDASSLAAFDIPQSYNQQFWLNIDVPAGTPAGTYTGYIYVMHDGDYLTPFTVSVEVEAITLLASEYEHTIFPFWYLVSDASATIGYSKSATQLQAEAADMFEHGVTSPIITDSTFSHLATILGYMRSIGYTTTRLYYNGLAAYMNVADADPVRLAALGTAATNVINVANDYGFTEVFFYGIDEAAAGDRPAEYPNWDKIHSVGGKVYVDGVSATAYVCAAKLDLLVDYGYPDQAAMAAMHAEGHEIMSYSDPQSGCELPKTYRENQGLVMWQNTYDGAHMFALQWWQGGTVWNDFGGTVYKGHVFAYPTIDGCVDTTEYEGWREGQIDCRYLATLNAAIAAAPPGAAKTAAQSYLAALKTTDLTTVDLDDVRNTMMDHILAL